MSEGVYMFGAASMGALRAAECAACGMIGIGEIYEGFESNKLEDDSDVAQAHAGRNGVSAAQRTARQCPGDHIAVSRASSD